MSQPGNINHALVAVAELCTALVRDGCSPVEVVTALAQMLGIATAAVACCPEHAAEAEDMVVEIFEDSLASNRIRFAAYDRVGDAGMHHQEGHA